MAVVKRESHRKIGSLLDSLEQMNWNWNEYEIGWTIYRQPNGTIQQVNRVTLVEL